MIFAKVAETENEEPIEIPIEPQGYILMSTLTAQFPGACGLKFKSEQFSWRGVRVVEDKLYPPDDKWDNNVYIVTYPKDSKRKGDDLDINSAKSRKIERKCVDLIVLGIPWKSTEEVVRRYFEQYGEVVLCEIKRDSTGNSKGFGFVRFKDYNHQCAVLGKKHYIDGRWCDVKIPNSQEPETSRKIFVGRLSESLTAKDLQDYFAQFGQVIDVYIPKPFRAFGFVTFVEAEIAQSLCGESHIIKGISVHVSRADPKEDDRHSRQEPPIPQNIMPNPMRRFPNANSSNGINPSSHHLSNTMSNNSINSNSTFPSGGGGGGDSRGGGGGSGSNKPIGNRNKAKYAEQMHHQIDLYDGRQRDMRSPGVLPPPPPPAHHHHSHHGQHGGQSGGGGGGSGGSGAGGGGGGSGSSNPSNSHHPGHHHQQQQQQGGHEQMNAMMNMFNPMMAAFIQQLASGIQPQGPSQPGLDGPGPHNGAPPPPPPPPLGHHHHGGPPPPPWAHSNDYSRNNNGSLAPGMPNSIGAYGGAGFNGTQHNARFKNEKF